ncbi:MAG: CcmD family protein [Bacteroidales bacterium]
MMRTRMIRYVVAALFMVALGTAVCAPLLAQAQQAPPGQNEFVPVKDLPKQEDLPAAPLVMGSYAFVWVVLVVYVWSLSRRLTKVQAEMAELRRRSVTRK